MTISGDVLRKLDSIVDGETIRSRSEAIESILNQYLEANKVAVILGGGDPERLRKIDDRLISRLRGGGGPNGENENSTRGGEDS